MTGWKRWVLLIGGGLIAAALIGAGLLAYLVSRVDVRAEVERIVENATGRDVTISGPVGVSFFPVLGLRARDATLANVEGGRAPAFITADEIDIGVEFGPLFNRRIEVRRLVLQRPRIALEVDAQGRPNWLLGPRPGPPGPPSPTPPPPPSFDLGDTALRSIRVNDGEVTFYDARRGSGWVVGEADISTAITQLDQPMQVEGSVRYNDRPLAFTAEITNPIAVARGQVTPLRFDIESELLNANFQGRTLASSGELSGIVRASGPSLRQLAAWSGSPIQGGVGFEQFAVSGRLVIGNGLYDFTNAGFAIDLVRGRGDFQLSERNGKPYVSGQLQLFDFDLNPYLTGRGPPAAEDNAVAAAVGAAGVPATAVTASSTPTAEIAAMDAPARGIDAQRAPSGSPVEFSGLRGFNANLVIVTAAVLVQHVRIDGSSLTLDLNEGNLAASIQNVSLYGGSGRGTLQINASAPVVAMNYDLAFDGLDARRFLTDAFNFTNIEGRAEFTLNLRTQGRTQAEMIAALDGRTHLEVVSGTLHGVDLGGVATSIRNALRGELIAPEAETPFQGFSATFAIADGVLAADNLSFNTEDLRIPGVGVIDLPRRRADLRLAPRSPRGGLVFPFSIRGPWSQFSYAADMNGAAQTQILTRVREVEAASRAGN